VTTPPNPSPSARRPREGLADDVARIASWPEVEAATAAARDACTSLRWHEGLRRRTKEAAAEARVRGAHASASLDGAPASVDLVREWMCGARPWSPDPDPVERVIRGAIQATAEAEHIAPVLRSAPLQSVARLHTAATAGVLRGDQVGRPRVAGDDVLELVELGAAPRASDVPERLRMLAGVLGTPGHGLVVAALAHAELLAVRPFVRGNGLVGRALERAVVIASGLDATGVVVPEWGHDRSGPTAYLGALSAYLTGTKDGLIVWIEHCSAAIIAGAEEGVRVADAVRAGRLGA
jgi:hypothetical protein